jgi:hypothetical protein
MVTVHVPFIISRCGVLICVHVVSDDSSDPNVPSLGPDVFQGVIGYESIDAHHAFQKTPEHDAGIYPPLKEFKASLMPIYGKAPFHVKLQLAR